MSAVRFSGFLSELTAAARATLLDRSLGASASVPPEVARIVCAVELGGDGALFDLAERYDGVRLSSLEVSREARRGALGRIDCGVRRALDRAAENLERVCRAELPLQLEVDIGPGVVVGRRPDPLERAGVYAPGGRAAYPSSVLMGVVPARVAGVAEIVVCSPPGPSGAPSDLVLAAAEIGGADRLFAVGGAGAVAAMALGTHTIPRVDVVVGPGNAYVAEAKRQLSGRVRIDSPAGPSELVVVADDSAGPAEIARELVAQAEHDEDACVVALVVGATLAEAIEREVGARVARAERCAIARAALRSRGAVLIAKDLDEAARFVARFAPEHVLLALRDPAAFLPRVRNTGTIFLGLSSSVAFGDYLTGGNHVLPTAGSARRASGLSVLDFTRWTGWQRVTPEGAAWLRADTQTLARAEGLFAHADAVAACGEQKMEPARPAPRAALGSIPRYAASPASTEVDLTDNTNMFGPPPKVIAALAEIPARAIARYPTAYSNDLQEVLACRLGVDRACVVTGCGSDDLLDATLRAFGDPGDTFAYCPPTFEIVASFAAANALRCAPVALDVDAIVGVRPRVVYLCSPNNPTGALLPAGLLDELLERTRALVILDEAYVEFAPVASRAAEAARSPRLVVVRTLSKAYGIAGARVGWAVASPGVAYAIERARGPYKVSAVAERLALAALDDEPWVRARVEDTLVARARFVAGLRRLGLSPLPTDANFVCLPVRDALATAEALRERGVSVRAFTNLAHVGDAVRISMGPWPVLERCLDALRIALGAPAASGAGTSSGARVSTEVSS